jgi:hypothetical protein
MPAMKEHTKQSVSEVVTPRARAGCFIERFVFVASAAMSGE